MVVKRKGKSPPLFQGNLGRGELLLFHLARCLTTPERSSPQKEAVRTIPEIK